jgi:hypothetical protein
MYRNTFRARVHIDSRKKVGKNAALAHRLRAYRGEKLQNQEVKTREKYTGRFIMFSVITHIYNKKTKGPTLMELFTATGKQKQFC